MISIIKRKAKINNPAQRAAILIFLSEIKSGYEARYKFPAVAGLVLGIPRPTIRIKR
jgi:hypothetical protein